MSWVKKEEIKKFLEEDTLDHIDELKEMTHKEAGEEEIEKVVDKILEYAPECNESSSDEEIENSFNYDLAKLSAKALKDKFIILRKEEK